MANAKKCDRCGTFYVKSYSLYSLTKVNGLFNPETELDLCPECSKELEKWVENKEPDNEALNIIKSAVITETSRVCGLFKNCSSCPLYHCCSEKEINAMSYDEVMKLHESINRIVEEKENGKDSES